MAFGCPICSEKLDKLPAEAQSRGGGVGELNVSATPCGHIFHSYCIQKWLTGNLASSKQCPCCRKDVPRLRCLPLFPTSYDESILDDSLSQEEGGAEGGGGGGGGRPIPCNHGEIIASLKNQIARLEGELKEKNQLYDLQSADYTTLMERFNIEKNTSDTWMMRAKQYESFQDVARDWENRAKKAEARLKTYTTVENMIKGVEVTVRDELSSFPPTVESVRSLLEMKHVLSSELKHQTAKITDLQKKYEEIRTDKMKVKGQLEKKIKEYKELQQVYEISRVNGKIRSASPSIVPSSGLTTTPKAFRTKRRFQEPVVQSSSESSSSGIATASGSSTGLDQDVDVFPTFKPKKAKPSTAPSSSSTTTGKVLKSRAQPKTTTAASKDRLVPEPFSPILPMEPPKTAEKKGADATINLSSGSEHSFAGDLDQDDDDDDFRIRGNVPGAPLPIPKKKIQTLQKKSERPILGLSTSTKKFTFKK